MRRVASARFCQQATLWRGLALAFALLASLITPGSISAATAPAWAGLGPVSYELVVDLAQGAVRVVPEEGVVRVRFYLDPFAMDLERGAVGERPASTVTEPPFAWREREGLDLKAWAGGQHTLVAAIDLADGRTVVKTARGATPRFNAVSASAFAAAPAADCTPLTCAQVKVAAPYVLTFDQNHGGLVDKNGVGTGFTWVDKPTASGTGYLPANLEVNTAAGVLSITTTPGIAYLESNNQDNALGVGIDAANQVSVLETRLVNIPVLAGELEQAGLWYGTDDDNYLKLVVISLPEGLRTQFVEERNGLLQQQVVSPVIEATGGSVLLQMRADPVRRTVTGYYSVNGSAAQELSTFRVPPHLFNGPGAVIDPAMGTSIFGGVFATDRFLQGVRVFQFDYFSLVSGGQVYRRHLPMVVNSGP